MSKEVRNVEVEFINRDLVRYLMNDLLKKNPRSCFVIQQRFGLNRNAHEYSYREIGEMIGVGAQRVRIIVLKALQTMYLATLHAPIIQYKGDNQRCLKRRLP